MKLSTWAKKMGISYRQAWQMFKDGKLPNAKQLPTGTIVVLEENEEVKPNNVVAIYARVSSHENKDNLERQVERLKEYAMVRGYQIKYIVKEVGSGVNDTRPKLIELLRKKDLSIVKVLCVENLKKVKYKKRGKFPREVNRRLSFWLYARALQRLAQRCEEEGVLLVRVPPRYTSQRCPLCGNIGRRNRKGETFRCINCGHQNHADIIGAMNVKHLWLAGVYSHRLLQNSTQRINVYE